MSFTVKGQALKALLLCASTDMFREALRHVYVCIQDDHVLFTATTGSILIQFSYVAGQSADITPGLIHRNFINRLRYKDDVNITGNTISVPPYLSADIDTNIKFPIVSVQNIIADLNKEYNNPNKKVHPLRSFDTAKIERVCKAISSSGATKEPNSKKMFLFPAGSEQPVLIKVLQSPNKFFGMPSIQAIVMPLALLEW